MSTNIAAGINKLTVVAKQAGLGSPVSGAGGQVLRRESCSFKLDKSGFESGEIVQHRQSTGTRYGLQAVNGKLSGLLSSSTYKLFMATAMRKDFVAGATTGAIVTVTAASDGANTGTGTFTRSAGSYLGDGFKTGDVMRWAGFAGGSAVNNNAHNFLITNLTATVMSARSLDGTDIVADAAGDSVTGTVFGKKTFAPTTGHTDDYFTFEEFYTDVGKSEYFTDVKLGGMNIDLPANGNCKAAFDFIGLRRQRFNAQQLTTPTVETSTGICAMVSGLLMVNGTVVANVTGVQINVTEDASASGPVVGSKFSPDITVGIIKVTGQFTAYFDTDTLGALFDNETVTSLVVVAAADNTPNSDFVAFNLGRIKLSGDAASDDTKGVLRTYPFTAEINILGGAGTSADQTIMSIQDSAA